VAVAKGGNMKHIDHYKNGFRDGIITGALVVWIVLMITLDIIFP
jgi:hypothetical protein